MRLSKLIGILTAVVLLLVAVTACGGSKSTTEQGNSKGTASTQAGTKKSFRIGITQIVQHPNLDAAKKGFIDQLAKDGFKVGDNITIDDQNAQNDMSLAKSIADKFAADKVDLILAISTPSSQAVAKATTNIPVVYVAVTDPQSAGLVKSIDQPSGTNITGVYNFDPVDAQMDLAAKIIPGINKLGTIYNAGESNSVATIKQLKTSLSKRNWTLVEANVSSTNEVKNAAQSLVGRVNAIYLPTDNTVISALEAVIKVAQDEKLPVFAGDKSTVERGAIATYGDDPADKGQQAALLAVKILKGTAPGTIKQEEVRKRVLYVNEDAAAKVGVKIPSDVLANAEKVTPKK